MISLKFAYYYVIVMSVNLKQKHGLVYNCLHVSVDLYLRRLVHLAINI